MAASPGKTSKRIGSGASGTKNQVKNAVPHALEFARGLNQRLAKGVGEINDADVSVQEIEKQLESLRLYAQMPKRNENNIETLEGTGTELWNTCNRLKRDIVDGPDARPLLRLALGGRCLAFFLLALPWREQVPMTQTVHLTRLALKTGRSCIDECDLDLKFSGTVLARATDFINHLQKSLTLLSDGEEIQECRSLIAEHFVVRTVLATKQDRLDVAEHMYQKAGPIRENLNPESAENMADLLFMIGKSLMAKNNWSLAAKWLSRASEVINSQSLDVLSREAVELRLAINRGLVTTLLELPDEDGIGRAQNIVNYMESEIGNAPVVSILKLEVIQKMPGEAFDDTGYSTVLRHMIRTFNFSEASFKLIVHHIQKLHNKSPELGCEVLDEFIIAVGPSDNDEWMEKLIISRVWMAIKQRESIENIEAVDNILSRLAKPLRAEATVAAQKLISTKLESSYTERHFDLAEKWCQLALHSAFANSGPGNVAKLERKKLLCALSQNDIDKAMSVIQDMSEKTRMEPMTAYLVFKVALRAENGQKASESLRVIGIAPSAQEYLSACVANSQQAGNIVLAIASMKKLFERFEYTAPNSFHLPALLRCMIRLSHQLLDSHQNTANEHKLVQDLCDLFDGALTAIARDPRDEHGNRLFNKDELDWLSRTAYNLGMKNTETWDLRQVVRILQSCVNLVEHYPKDISSEAAGDLSLKSMFSHFIIASALVGLARCGDHAEQQLQDYLIMRKHITAFDAQLLPMLGGMEDPSADDMRQKLATMLCYDFEAAICLQKWEELSEIVRKAKDCGSVIAFQAMADCLLRSDASGTVLSSVMILIINEIWNLEDFDNGKLAKYTRCLFQATLALDEGRSLSILQETVSRVQESSEEQTPWPEEELEWMATTAYDHGIDCWSSGQDEGAKQWIMSAINLAHYNRDGGALEKMMHKRYLTLKFKGAEG